MIVIDTKAKYDELLDLLLKQDGPIACDVETEAFSDERWLPWELKLEGLGLWTPEASGFILPHLLDSRIQEILSKKKLLFHNAKFDLGVLEGRWYNSNSTDYEDTLIMAWLLDENRDNGLKDLAQSVLKVSPETIKKYNEVSEKPEQLVNALIPDTWYEESVKKWYEEIGSYCLDDCRYTYQLYKIFKEQLEKEGLTQTYEQYEKPFIRVLRRMERHGITVDLNYLDVLDGKLQSSLIKLSTELDELVKPYVKTKMNYNSAPQLKALFFTTLGYKLPEGLKTKKGGDSTNAEALDYIIKKYECKIAAKLLEFREQTKLWSTYVVGLKKMQRKDLVHTNFNQTGTVTGRLSSSKPNLQNIPRSNETEFDIRRAFIARPGHSFVISDYSQIELRLMAHFSGSKVMKQNYIDKGDIYKTVAAQIGSSRQDAKAVVLGINYGRTAYGLGKGLKISEDDAQVFIDGYFKVFPEVQKFLDDSAKNLALRPFIRTLSGRYRHFPEYVEARRRGQDGYAWRMERQAGNAIIQGSASDVIKLAMLKLDQELEPLGARLLVQIHDELIVECKDEQVEAVKEIVKECMEAAVPLNGVDLLVEPSVSKHWTK